MSEDEIIQRVLSDDKTAILTAPVAGGYIYGSEFKILHLEDKITDYQVRDSSLQQYVPDLFEYVATLYKIFFDAPKTSKSDILRNGIILTNN